MLPLSCLLWPGCSYPQPGHRWPTAPLFTAVLSLHARSTARGLGASGPIIGIFRHQVQATQERWARGHHTVAAGEKGLAGAAFVPFGESALDIRAMTPAG